MGKIDLDLVEKTVSFFSKLSIDIEKSEDAKENFTFPIVDDDYKKHIRNATHFLDHYLFLCEQDVIKNNYQKRTFCITDDDRDHIEISIDPISVSKLVFHINQIKSDRLMKRLKSTQVTNWLMKLGYLQDDPTGITTHKICTSKSGEIGITSSECMNTHNQSYHVNLYDQNAQRYVVENSNQISMLFD